jgi:hypothetical protein
LFFRITVQPQLLDRFSGGEACERDRRQKTPVLLSMGLSDLLQAGGGFWKVFFPALSTPKGGLGSDTSHSRSLFC